MENYINLHKPESHFQNFLPWMVAHQRQICPRFESQRWSSTYYILEVSTGGQIPLPLAHGVTDLQAYLLGLRQPPDPHLFQLPWSLFLSFSDAWDGYWTPPCWRSPAFFLLVKQVAKVKSNEKQMWVPVWLHWLEMSSQFPMFPYSPLLHFQNFFLTAGPLTHSI